MFSKANESARSDAVGAGQNLCCRGQGVHGCPWIRQPERNVLGLLNIAAPSKHDRHVVGGRRASSVISYGLDEQTTGVAITCPDLRNSQIVNEFLTLPCCWYQWHYALG